MQPFAHSKNKFSYVYMLTPHYILEKNGAEQSLPETRDEMVQGVAN